MTTLHLFRENNCEDVFAAPTLDDAKLILVGMIGVEEAKECDDWEEYADDASITVDCDGEKVTKTASEWANDEPIPGYRFGGNY